MHQILKVKIHILVKDFLADFKYYLYFENALILLYLDAFYEDLKGKLLATLF